MNQALWLGAIAVGGYLQNMAHTWSGRSKNGGDPRYHLWAALASNGVWILSWSLIWHQMWTIFKGFDLVGFVIFAVVYTLSTSMGSVHAMSILLKRESGHRAVGANPYARKEL